MKLKHFTIPLTGLALTLLANLSYAADYKVYPGSGCKPGFGGDASSFETLGTTIRNISTQPRVVTCPLVREYVAATELLDPGMRVASYNGALLGCYFLSYDQNGVSLDYVYKATTSTAAFPLVFSGAKTIVTLAAGSYAFQCYLPPNGVVFNYSLGEPPSYGYLP
jgi:hypothetical protein